MPFEFFRREQKSPEEESKKREKTSRREFLKKAGQVTGGALLGADLLYNTTRPAVEQKKESETFSWPKLNEEIDRVKKEFGGHTEQEIKKRIRAGIEQYLRVWAEEELARKGQKGPPLVSLSPNSPGFAEGLVAGLVVDTLRKFAGSKQSFEDLDSFNRVLLFGGAGAGVALMLERLDKIMREKDMTILFQRFKTDIEELAYKTAVSRKSEDSEIISVTTERLDDLATVIAQNIAKYNDYLVSGAGAKTILEQWGAGAALTHAPLFSVMEDRSKGVHI